MSLRGAKRRGTEGNTFRCNLPVQCLFLLYESMNGTRRLPRRALRFCPPRNDIFGRFCLRIGLPTQWCWSTAQVTVTPLAAGPCRQTIIYRASFRIRFSRWPERITGGLGSTASQDWGCFSSSFMVFSPRTIVCTVIFFSYTLYRNHRFHLYRM